MAEPLNEIIAKLMWEASNMSDCRAMATMAFRILKTLGIYPHPSGDGEFYIMCPACKEQFRIAGAPIVADEDRR